MSQHPPVHHPKTPILGFHGWDETVPQGSVYLVNRFYLLLLLIFLNRFFSLSQFLFFWQQFYYHFFFGAPLTPSCFLGSSYLPSKLKPCEGGRLSSSSCEALRQVQVTTISSTIALRQV